MVRVVICGIGNKLYGDEGIGPESLIELKKEVKRKDVLFLDCGRSPQDKTKKVLDYKPAKVIIISALDMKKGTGMVEELEPKTAKRFLMDDGQVDVGMFVGYLSNALEGKVLFVGYQPWSREKGHTLSLEARNALIIIKELVLESLRFIKTISKR